MKWSWRIATVAGIGVYIHFTFPLLLLWAGFRGYASQQSWPEAFREIAFIAVLFVIVVLHELGHALTARRFGITTKDITLLPIGGVARLERMPEEPKQELLVALAGPAVNVVLVLLIFGGLAIGAQVVPLNQLLESNEFLVQLLVANIALAVFNLLPAFPMDGGRVLRALLATRMNYARATNIAARVGQGMAVLFAIAGMFGPSLLVLVALFVWMGAAQESGIVQMKFALGGARVEQVMITDFRTLAPDDTLSKAVEFLLNGYQQDFPVVSEGRLIGILTRSALVSGLSRLGSNMPVADAMEKVLGVAHPDEPVESVFPRLQNSSSRSLPVVADEHLLGIVTSENVAEYLMVQTAMQKDLKSGPTTLRFTERHAT